MQPLQFLATWLFPGAVVYAAAAAELAVASASAAVSSEHARTSSSSPTSSVKAAESVSSLSSPSSPSSSEDRAPRFSPSPKQTPSLCFGAGGAGRLLWGGARARAPAKQDDDVAAAVSAAMKGDAVGKYLRRISGRLRKARTAGKASASASASASPSSADDDTARERAESVARAVAYCKDTLRRGAAPPTPTPPSPQPSLEDWLHHDRQEEIEIIASAEAHGDERRDSQRMDSPCPATSPTSRDYDGSLTSAAGVVHGQESSPNHHDHGAGDECRGESVKEAETATKTSSPSDLAAGRNLEMLSSFDEMDSLKIFDGDKEMIDHHFITIQI